MKNKIMNNFNLVNRITFIVITLSLGACSSSLLSGGGNTKPLSLQPADDMKQGPGIFSGDKGSFYIIGGDKNKQKSIEKQNSSVTYYPKPIANMNLNETSKVLENKIRQLEKDQMELELLKREIDKKIKAQ